MPEPPNSWETIGWGWLCSCGKGDGQATDFAYDDAYVEARWHADSNPTHHVRLYRKQSRWVVPDAR